MLRNANIKKTSKFHYLLVSNHAHAIELSLAYYRQSTSPWLNDQYRAYPRGYYARAKVVDTYKDHRGKRVFREYGTVHAQLYMQTSQFSALEFRHLCARFTHAVKCYATKERCIDDLFFCVAELVQGITTTRGYTIVGLVADENIHEKHVVTATGAV